MAMLAGLEQEVLGFFRASGPHPGMDRDTQP